MRVLSMHRHPSKKLKEKCTVQSSILKHKYAHLILFICARKNGKFQERLTRNCDVEQGRREEKTYFSFFIFFVPFSFVYGDILLL